jgi:hypothetical protein
LIEYEHIDLLRILSKPTYLHFVLYDHDTAMKDDPIGYWSVNLASALPASGIFPYVLRMLDGGESNKSALDYVREYISPKPYTPSPSFGHSIYIKFSTQVIEVLSIFCLG